jgi:fructose-1-phosphate kinase PfkB-like protein
LGRISSESLNKLIKKIEDTLVLSESVPREFFIESLQNLSFEIQEYMNSNVMDMEEALLLLEKIEVINNVLKTKMEETVKILKNKQKEEKLLQEVKKLLSDII